MNHLNASEQLTAEQARRATALRTARSIVSDHRGPNTPPQPINAEAVQHTVELAEYILTGTYPELTTEGA